MSAQVKEIVEMLEMLPEQEQNLAFEMIKRIVLAWDSDYTKLTKKEAQELEEAKNSEFIDDSEIDWNHLENYA
ncbi:MAG: hypothetical protein V3G42_01225 [Oscillospiraceae bacterium]